ncbi:hypothetical protein TTHERM_000336019 (macronuclear) [Tetrahymena thermophila SB210]|uniref:DBF4-type domain-containing protein n=1 Tax=Tetrahymena thermophila (strain SB210) TaxID=312017 RepID=W7X9L1_TETTS|nr:hypothetical protein TTHERM_000336019 [Tetrahymena thermophila SB210]EWS74032.1 hypothetical protein TTHERM_000336019 [Tetrahymena thermophila SB210]|eukprot:XP_012653431.1 hypothetical protein TTHERM_000336019 [Tetrahymena thermophila SB210]
MNNNEDLNNQAKRGRGRPKGSKNKPKLGQEIQVQRRQQSSSIKKIPPKISKKTNKKQLDTYFIIKPKTGGKCYYQTEIMVDYTPYKEHECQEKVSIVPRLNTDNKPHIPGFIMDMDRGYYEKHDQRYKEDHEAKISDYTKAKSRLYLPKPGKRHNYCCVCKQSYDDYLDHVQSNSHKKAYNNNEFTTYIMNISKQYEHNHRNINKAQELPDQQTDTLTQDEDDLQLIGFTDSSTQKFGNKINEKQNKGSPNQYINGNAYQNQTLIKKAQSQINTNDMKGHTYIQKSVSMIAKTGPIIENNFERMGGQYPNHSTQAACLGLSTKTSSTNFYAQMQMSTNQATFHQVPTFPTSDENLVIQEVIPNLSNNNSHNNSLNNMSNNNNNTNNHQIIKNSFIKQKIIPAHTTVNNNLQAPGYILNMKRKAENYPQYNDTLEATRKQQFQPKIIDLTEDGNDSQKHSAPLIATQNQTQNRMPSANSQMMYYPFVVCND